MGSFSLSPDAEPVIFRTEIKSMGKKKRREKPVLQIRNVEIAEDEKYLVNPVLRRFLT